MDPPQRCKMNVYGSDGLGRRVEAVFNCVAIAEAFGLTYLHAPFRRLQPPGTNVTKVNGWFGLTASLGPTKSEYSLIRSLQRNRTSRSPVLTSHLTDCRAETSVNATTRTLGSVDRQGQPTWYQRLADGTSECGTDRLYTGEDCFDGVRCTEDPRSSNAAAPLCELGESQ